MIYVRNLKKCTGIQKKFYLFSVIYDLIQNILHINVTNVSGLITVIYSELVVDLYYKQLVLLRSLAIVTIMGFDGYGYHMIIGILRIEYLKHLSEICITIHKNINKYTMFIWLNNGNVSRITLVYYHEIHKEEIKRNIDMISIANITNGTLFKMPHRKKPQKETKLT